MRRPLAVTVVALLMTTAACGLDETARDAADQLADDAQSAISGLTSDVATATVGDAVEQVLGEAGYTLDEPPDCTGSLEAVGVRLSGKVTCTGTVSTGAAYEATFDGAVSLRGRCPGTLSVVVDGGEKVTAKRVDACRLARLLNSMG